MRSINEKDMIVANERFSVAQRRPRAHRFVWREQVGCQTNIISYHESLVAQ